VSLDQITQAAQQRDVVIYTIGLFGRAEPPKGARDALDHLAERSGGMAYYPDSIARLNEVARDVAHQIRNQCTLGYTPLNQALDGSYRAIQVTVSGHERLYPRTRAGYRALP
jgi:VWFA-related protein